MPTVQVWLTDEEYVVAMKVAKKKDCSVGQLLSRLPWIELVNGKKP